jgi:hypothetical protein
LQVDRKKKPATTLEETGAAEVGIGQELLDDMVISNLLLPFQEVDVASLFRYSDHF